MSKEDPSTACIRPLSKLSTAKTTRIREVAMPVIQATASKSGLNSMILVLITDGKRVFSLPVNIIDAYNSDAAPSSRSGTRLSCS